MLSYFCLQRQVWLELELMKYPIYLWVILKWKRTDLWRNIIWVEWKKIVISKFPSLPSIQLTPEDHGKGPFKKVWPIQQGKSQVKQLYKHYDFNNKISGIWLQPLNPMKHSRGHSSVLVCVLVWVYACVHTCLCVHVCEYIHTCSSGFVSNCVIPWLVPELVCCSM